MLDSAAATLGDLHQRHEVESTGVWIPVGLGGVSLVWGVVLLNELPDRTGGMIAAGVAGLVALICLYGAFSQRGICLELYEHGILFREPSGPPVVLPYREIAKLSFVTRGWHTDFRVKKRDGVSLSMMGFAHAPSAYTFVSGKLRSTARA